MRSLLCSAFAALFAAGVLVLPSSGQVPTKIRPFAELVEGRVDLKRENIGTHPRLFFTKDDIDKFRKRAKGEGLQLWKETLDDIKTLSRSVPDPADPDLYKSGLDSRKPGSMSQYNVAFQISQTALAYAIEKDERYLAAAKKWIMAVCEMPLWGYTYNKPNVDLPPAHLLYAVAFAYDVLYEELTTGERQIIREKLLKQGRLMYDHFKYKPGKRYTYSQNHTWIPMAGLGIAAYAIMDEEPEALEWAKLARAVFDRTMITFGRDGYFYEGFHYLGFAFRWMIRYFDAHLAATGEDLYAVMRPSFGRIKLYAAHSILPDGENVFDLADIGDGSLNRNGESKRESIYGEYDIIHRLAAVYNDPQAQAVGDHIRANTNLGTREPMWAFINRDPDLKAPDINDLPRSVHFEDSDTFFWRSDWTPNATAFAFRSGPPEGHHAGRLAKHISDWRQNTGHAHPDANSFIIWANGRYMTGDTGYLGIKQTDDHNTILINGRGQANDGVYEMFKDVPNEKLDKINVADVWDGGDVVYIKGDAASAYFDDLGVTKFDRHFIYIKPDKFIVFDEVITDKPAKVTFMLNADRSIKLTAAGADIVNDDAVLSVTRLLPDRAETSVADQIVQARGLPGSVAKGDTEKRGLQLRIDDTHAAENSIFLNFMSAGKVSDCEVFPKAALTDRDDLIVTITNSDGTTDTIFLRGGGKDVLSDAAFAMIRTDQAGKPLLAAAHNASFFEYKGRVIFKERAKRSVVIGSANF